MKRFALAALAASLFACGSSSSDSSPTAPDGGAIADASSFDATANDGSVDANAAVDAAEAGLGFEAPVVETGKGSVMKTPRLVAVTFDADPEQDGIDALTKSIGASAYWKTVTAEYGVGATTGDVIHLSETAPAIVDPNAGDSENYLATRFDGTHPEWGTFDPNALYLLFYPPTTVAKGDEKCGPAYHSALPINAIAPDAGADAAAASAQMIYGVVFKCAKGDPTYPTGFDDTTLAASHEMFEAVTDPDGDEYAEVDADHAAWCYFLGSELGDMCALSPGQTIKPLDLGFAVQRMWSNAAMAAGRDPCIPGTPGPVLFAVPRGDASVRMLGGEGQTITTRGFVVPVGQTKTIDVVLQGASTDEWTVTPYTLAMERGGKATVDPYLSFAFDRTSGHAGDVLHLSITRVADDATYSGDSIKLVTSNGDAAVSWFVAIGE